MLDYTEWPNLNSAKGYFSKLKFFMESSKMYYKDDILNIIFRGFDLENSEIRLKSEKLHPWWKVGKVGKDFKLLLRNPLGCR